MNIGLVITMYDEFDVVKETILNVKKANSNATIVVIHSDNNRSDETLDFIKVNSTYIILEDLSKTMDMFELPSASICRNYRIGFKTLYDVSVDYDLIIGITGDTLILNLDEIISQLSKKHIGHVLQAVGQFFHDKNDNPKNGICCNRFQSEATTDIMPQFFIFDGKFATKNLLFTFIENLNKFTSEQNLGDEILKHAPSFHTVIKRLHNNQNVYDYNLGIQLQTKGLGHTRLKQ